MWGGAATRGCWGQLGPSGEGQTRPAQDTEPFQAEPGPASCTRPPVAGEETEARRPFAHCQGWWVCWETSRLPWAPSEVSQPTGWGLGLGHPEMRLRSSGERKLVLGPVAEPLPLSL